MNAITGKVILENRMTINGNRNSPLSHLLKADDWRNPDVVIPERRKFFEEGYKKLADKGVLSWEDPVEMFQSKPYGFTFEEAQYMANCLEVMQLNNYSFGEGFIRNQVAAITGGITEDTLSTDIANFTRLSIGMVPSIFPRLLSTVLFNVQPFSHPSQYIFYKTYERKTDAYDGEDISDVANKTTSYANDPGEGQTGVREVGAKITSELLETTLRKLRWKQSYEAAVKAQAYHGIALEALNNDALRTDLALEVDLELIDHAIANAGYNVNWNPSPSGYDSYTPSEKKAYDRTLFDTVEDVITEIVKQRYVPRSSIWICGGPSAVSRLRKCNDTQIREIVDNDGMINRGSKLNFILNAGNRVYEYSWMDDNILLLGYKGNEPIDGGMIYTPFIPFFMTPVLWDTNMNFTFGRGGLTWYGKKMVIPEMFGTVTITSS